MRYFHNFYSIFQLNERLGLTLGFDYGWQQKTKGSSEYDTWYSPVAILKYSPSNKMNVALRGEYYSDKNQVIIATGTPNGFQTWGYSVNLDYNIADNLMWRIEARGLNNKDQSFVTRENNPSNQNYIYDVKLTSDQVPVIYHDYDINIRLTLKSPIIGALSKYKYKTLETYVRLVNGEKIPKLEDVLSSLLMNKAPLLDNPDTFKPSEITTL